MYRQRVCPRKRGAAITQASRCKRSKQTRELANITLIFISYHVFLQLSFISTFTSHHHTGSIVQPSLLILHIIFFSPFPPKHNTSSSEMASLPPLHGDLGHKKTRALKEDSICLRSATNGKRTASCTLLTPPHSQGSSCSSSSSCGSASVGQKARTPPPTLPWIF